MSEEQDKNLIKNGLESPSKDFTRNVMQAISYEETAISKIIKPHIVEEPSSDFTAQLMSALPAKKPFRYEPVISKKAWLMIAASILIITILLIFKTPENPAQGTWFQKPAGLVESMSGFFTQLASINYLLMIVLGISAALLLDQQIKHRRLFG